MSPMIYTAYGFAIFFLVFWCGKWCIHLLAIAYGKYKLHRKVIAEPSDKPMPTVSILKPLMGVDPNLKQNLETFFTMNYPAYELLFCIEDRHDKAVELVHELCARHPHVRTQLFLGGSNVGVNPKINNMNPGYEAALSDYIMISDSGIRMKDDTLLDMVQHMVGRTALVHQMPFTCDRDGFAATFEKIFFGTVQSRIYLTADLLGINCHTGMSCLLRADVLRQLGGLRAFGCYLAEDFFIAKAVADAGWRTAVCSQPAMQNSGHCDLGSFQARLQRWAKLRQAMMPPMIVMEPMSECMVVGMCAAWAVSVLFGWTALVFYMVHVLLWFLSDWMLLSIVQNGALPFCKFEFVVGWLLREFSGPYLFVLALWNPAIRWRTRVYKLAWGGLAYELDERAAAAEEKPAVYRIAAAAVQPLKKATAAATKANRSPVHVRRQLGPPSLAAGDGGDGSATTVHVDAESGLMMQELTTAGGHQMVQHQQHQQLHSASEADAATAPLMQVVVVGGSGAMADGGAMSTHSTQPLPPVERTKAAAATTKQPQHSRNSSATMQLEGVVPPTTVNGLDLGIALLKS